MCGLGRKRAVPDCAAALCSSGSHAYGEKREGQRRRKAALAAKQNDDGRLNPSRSIPILRIVIGNLTKLSLFPIKSACTEPA